MCDNGRPNVHLIQFDWFVYHLKNFLSFFVFSESKFCEKNILNGFSFEVLVDEGPLVKYTIPDSFFNVQ